MRRRAGLAAAALVAVATGCGGGAGGGVTGARQPATAPSAPLGGPVRVAVSPAEGGTHTRFTVTITRQQAVGVFAHTSHAYSADVLGIKPASGCVNTRDRDFPNGPVGARAQAVLDPARGDGGSLGWCRGTFRGEIAYFEQYACPSVGACHAPPGFQSRTRLVANFTIRVT